ncbi:MAG: tetraacyldisaccharide 4'-kinase [Leptospiraceae bacterium]|nr:tetraacyldisaccharide 4'-kinase [Leptospiraceae bacterium]MCP5494661.1 tetraacyldisaccharide 4'-kinase [Leptospiraceae bacterium]
MFFLKKKNTSPQKIPNSLVISVGNLSVGGTGKTPFVIYLSNLIAQLDNTIQITILSRGYGGKNSKQGMKVENDSNPIFSGDEPLLIKKSLENANVIIGVNRLASYQKYANTNTGKNVILLDDGFQHFAIERNLDIVLVDSIRLLGNGFTIPLGTLREKHTALKRARIVVFTKSEQANPNEIEKITAKFLAVNPSLQIYHSYYETRSLLNLLGDSLDIIQVSGQKVFTFSGIASPETFVNSIKKMNPALLGFQRFKDHYSYSENDILKILKTASEYDLVVCTEKDYVKIKDYKIESNLAKKIYYLKISLCLKKEDEFLDYLRGMLKITS